MLEFFSSKQDLLDLKERIDSKMNQKIDRVLTALGKQTTILKRLDEERVFTFEHVKRLEKRVEEAEVDIKNIKVQLAIA